MNGLRERSIGGMLLRPNTESNANVIEENYVRLTTYEVLNTFWVTFK